MHFSNCKIRLLTKAARLLPKSLQQEQYNLLNDSEYTNATDFTNSPLGNCHLQ